MKKNTNKGEGGDRDRICISGPPGFHLWLKRVAMQRNTDMSKLVRDALDDYLKLSWEGQQISKDLKDELNEIRLREYSRL